jgi:hypothetical protein
MRVRNDPRVTTKTGYLRPTAATIHPQKQILNSIPHPTPHLHQKRQLSPPNLVASVLVMWLDFDDSDVSTPSQQNVFDVTSFRDVPKMK